MRKALLPFLLVFVALLQAYSAVGKKEIRIRLTEGSSSVFDETRIFLDWGNRQYIAAEDGQKVFDSTSSAPVIYSFSGDGIACSSNSFGTFTTNIIIPLGIKVTGNGGYTFAATLMDNFDATSIIRLEDRATGIFHDMRMGGYTEVFNQATQDDNRFVLHVSYPAQISSAPAGCSNNDGMIFVSQDNSLTWTSCGVYDAGMNPVFNNNFITGNFSFGTLPGGDYNLVFSFGPYTTVKPVHVVGQSIECSISASTANAFTGQSVQFFSNTTNADNFLWDFGDGSQITGIANPDYTYLLPGTYVVTLTCTNIYGCSQQTTDTITIAQGTGIGSMDFNSVSVSVLNRSLRVLVTEPLKGSENLQLLNTMGQLVQSGSITQGENNFDLNSLASGVYVARISGGTKAFSKKIILP